MQALIENPEAQVVEGSNGLLLEVDGQIVPNYDATMQPFEEGEVVTGNVVRIDRDEVLVDIGYKSEGVIPANERSIRKSVDPREEVELGEEVDAIVRPGLESWLNQNPSWGQAVVVENGHMLRLAPGRAEIVDEVPAGRIHRDVAPADNHHAFAELGFPIRVNIPQEVQREQNAGQFNPRHFHALALLGTDRQVDGLVVLLQVG